VTPTDSPATKLAVTAPTATHRRLRRGDRQFLSRPAPVVVTANRPSATGPSLTGTPVTGAADTGPGSSGASSRGRRHSGHRSAHSDAADPQPRHRTSTSAEITPSRPRRLLGSKCMPCTTIGDPGGGLSGLPQPIVLSMAAGWVRRWIADTPPPQTVHLPVSSVPTSLGRATASRGERRCLASFA
jgi:hypothetical protein